MQLKEARTMNGFKLISDKYLKHSVFGVYTKLAAEGTMSKMC